MFSSGALQGCHLTLPTDVGQCMLIYIGSLSSAKVGTCEHGTPTPTYKGFKREFTPTNNVEYEFWFCPYDIKHCVSGNKKKYVVD